MALVLSASWQRILPRERRIFLGKEGLRHTHEAYSQYHIIEEDNCESWKLCVPWLIFPNWILSGEKEHDGLQIPSKGVLPGERKLQVRWKVLFS